MKRRRVSFNAMISATGKDFVFNIMDEHGRVRDYWTVRSDDLPKEIQYRLMLHGARQRLADLTTVSRMSGDLKETKKTVDESIARWKGGAFFVEKK